MNSHIVNYVVVSFFSKRIMETKQYSGVDLTKFICAFLILCIHWEPFAGLNNTLNSVTVNFLARLAVPFFFIASGFFAFRKIDSDNVDLSVTWKSVKKLLKLYLILSVIYLPFTIVEVVKADNLNEALNILLSWIKNMFFTAGYGFLWYLPATAFAVFAVAVMLKKKISFKVIISLGIVLFAVGLLGQTYFGAIKPLSEYEGLWHILKCIRDIIVTTRNGLFEGLLFVALGAALAHRRIKERGLWSSLIGFVISLGLLFTESYLLSTLDWKLEYDMYIFMVPAAFFLFEIALNVNFNKPNLSRCFRIYSTLFYLTHMLVVELAFALELQTKMPSIISFVLIAVTTLALDSIIIKLSELKQFKFLKNLYL